MFPENLTRKFSNTESNYPYIIPALRNGMVVTVTVKVAREFKFMLADCIIIKGGKPCLVRFDKAPLGLVTMQVVEKNNQ